MTVGQLDGLRYRYFTPHLFPRTTAALVVRLVPAGPHASASPQRRGGGGGGARRDWLRVAGRSRCVASVSRLARATQPAPPPHGLNARR